MANRTAANLTSLGGFLKQAMKLQMKSRTVCHSVLEMLPEMSISKIISTHSQLNFVLFKMDLDVEAEKRSSGKLTKMNKFLFSFCSPR